MSGKLTLILCIVGASILAFQSCLQSSGAIEPFEKSIDEQKIALGRQLFFDKRLSVDNTISCASCHDPKLAFTNGKQFGVGVGGQFTDRNVPTILNSKFLKTIMFDGEIKSLERQIIVPIQEHNEMGSRMGDLIPELKRIKYYRDAAKKLYKREFDAWVLTRSIASYERSLIRMNSRYDKYIEGDKKSLTVSEIRGLNVFSKKLYCTECHPLGHFTTFSVSNNGLYADYGKDQGRYRITEKDEDRGKFKIPSLRNIGVTAPYMHDGSIQSLEEVIQHYASGGKSHPNQSTIIQPFSLTLAETKDLVLFLKSLTDE